MVFVAFLHRVVIVELPFEAILEVGFQGSSQRLGKAERRHLEMVFATQSK